MAAFEELLRGRPNRLVAAALEIGAELDDACDVSAAEAELAALLGGFELYLSVHADPHQRNPLFALDHLNQYFFRHLGFVGDRENYYDPRNSLLHEVLARRVGIPITLSVIYRELAFEADVDLCGVNLPGHFMLAYPPRSAPRLYIDVYAGGVVMDWPSTTACLPGLHAGVQNGDRPPETAFPPMSDREILVRMLRNLKGILARSDPGRAVLVQERLVRLVPGEPGELRDLGFILAAARRPRDALAVFGRLAERFPEHAASEQVRHAIGRARRIFPRTIEL